MNQTWNLTRSGYDPETHNHLAPVYTVGNGFICCRGFMEEQREGIAGLGGVYMAGVFGRASYKPWKGEGQELCNLPNLFRADVLLDGRPLRVTPEALRDYTENLDLRRAVLTRRYTYGTDGGPLAELTFERFCSWADVHLVGQRVTVKPLREGLDVRVSLSLDPDVTNLNEVSSEPYPVQPGKRHLEVAAQEENALHVRTDGPERTELAFAQRVTEPEPWVFEKLVYLAEPGERSEPLAAARAGIAAAPPFAEALAAHEAAVAAFWADADVAIDGDGEAQTALRYNLLQLEQSRPRLTDRVSIGARGLTGEMYEGSVFWDTEIFMLPFFTMTDPDAARKLLMFRYHTLPEAREHAKSNWFKGAMYGWQVNAQGVEQTPQGAGAYYSVHIVADVAFAVLEYWNATGDDDFILRHGLEILVETARYWQSRVTLRPDGQYDILAVRGPNEYDVLVNNNLYTNLMARENFLLCDRILRTFSEKYPQELNALTARLGFSPEEADEWHVVAAKLHLPYDPGHDLWLEDDTWLRRKPVDMAQAKPTAKRVIDTAIPYEALPLYQITKQADVLHAMKNLPWRFTGEQIQTAYDHYRPRTAFDSSLAYSMFALMAARLGRPEEALGFFNSCVNLDIRNVQLNTISGLHFANFGGTWQAAVFGFGGVSVLEDRLDIRPNLPPSWNRLAFRLRYRAALLGVEAAHGGVRVALLEAAGAPVSLSLCGKAFTLAHTGDLAQADV
jgi:kojibiose phosphorylase